MTNEELFKSKFYWVFMGWCVIVATAIGFVPGQIRQNIWILSAIATIVWLGVKKKLDYYTVVGSVMFGPIILFAYLTIYYDVIGKMKPLIKNSVKKIDTWIRE